MVMEITYFNGALEWAHEGKRHRYISWDQLERFRFPVFDSLKPTPDDLRETVDLMIKSSKGDD